MSYDGFINLYKEVGGSSQNAVSAIKHILHAKVGHCGTLDPLASGVLPVCVGKATRLAELVMTGEKKYIGTVCFGRATDSYDAGGEITARADASAVTQQAVAAVIPGFIGDIMQTAPVISALKKDGLPLYKRARRGEQVTAPTRQVHIDDIRLLDFIPGSLAYAKIEVTCGHGVYIRSLAHDLGEALGYPAYLSALERISCGKFDKEDAYTLEQIRQMFAAGDTGFIIPMEDKIGFLTAITANKRQLQSVSHGNDLRCSGQIPGTLLRICDEGGKLAALAKVSTDGRWAQVSKVFIEAQNDLACAIGNFDGLHLGHRALFKSLHQQKQQRGCRTAVLTFEPHPLKVIRGEAPPLLTSEKLKNDMLTQYFDIDKVVTLEFDQQVMNSSPEEFVEEIICRRLKANSLVVGFNFTFASKGQGDSALLRQLAGEKGIDVTVVDEVDSEYGTVSSTQIRRHLAEGDMEAVNNMLGYWFVMEGMVIHGNHLGRTLGFPTANFRVAADQAMPPKGVYAVRIQHGEHTYDGVANFGFKPTVGGEDEPLVEAFLFDTEQDLYGENIRVWFGKFLRPEKRFSGIEELRRQIAANCREAREFFAQIPANSHLPKPLV